MERKTRTITMDDEHHRKARIIAANKGVPNISALYERLVDDEWNGHYPEYEALFKNKLQYQPRGNQS